MNEKSKYRQSTAPKTLHRVAAPDTAKPRLEPPDPHDSGRNASLLLPHDFYEEFTARPDVRKILTRLAE